MSDEEPGRKADQRYARVRAAASFYQGTTAILLLVVIVQAAVLVWEFHRARFARALRVNGQIICFVSNERAARQVHDKLLAEEKGSLPGAAAFAQQWEDLNWPLGKDDKVLGPTEAVAAVMPRVTVKVAAAAIQLHKRNLVILPTQEEARQALDKLKSGYAGTDFLYCGLLPADVTITAVQAPPRDIVREVAGAVKMLQEPATTTAGYTVARRDTWQKVAAKYGTTEATLRQVNPGGGRVLHRGDKLAVPVKAPKLTVVVVKKQSREEPYSAPPEKLLTNTLARGITRTTIQARPGKKVVTWKITEHNGTRVSAEKIDEQITQPAVPERIMVGTGETGGGSSTG